MNNNTWQKTHPLILPIVALLIWSATLFLFQQSWSPAETVTTLVMASGILITLAYVIHDWLATIFVRIVPVDPARAELTIQRALSRLGVPFQKKTAQDVVEFALHSGHLSVLIEAFTPRRTSIESTPATKLTLRLVTPINASFARHLRQEIDDSFVARGFAPIG